GVGDEAVTAGRREAGDGRRSNPREAFARRASRGFVVDPWFHPATSTTTQLPAAVPVSRLPLPISPISERFRPPLCLSLRSRCQEPRPFVTSRCRWTNGR